MPYMKHPVRVAATNHSAPSSDEMRSVNGSDDVRSDLWYEQSTPWVTKGRHYILLSISLLNI